MDPGEVSSVLIIYCLDVIALRSLWKELLKFKKLLQSWRMQRSLKAQLDHTGNVSALIDGDGKIANKHTNI